MRRLPAVPTSAAVALALGAALAIGGRVIAPSAPALYDSIPTVEPYRYLDPASGQAGNPTSFAASPGLDNGASRAFVAATTETPPQAQLIALGGALTPPSGATQMNVTIMAVEAGQSPAQGSIAGNVYEFSVLDQNGTSFTLTPGQHPTLTLRAPQGVDTAVIGHLTTEGWVALPTTSGGVLGVFQIEPTELGDYAILTGVSPPADLGTVALILLSVFVPLIVAIAYAVRRIRRQQRAAAAEVAAQQRARIPTKRRRRR